jgi:hypothetical protein
MHWVRLALAGLGLVLMCAKPSLGLIILIVVGVIYVLKGRNQP